jgi:hypothetical protein
MRHNAPLDLDKNLVGRHSDRKNIHPEIMIADPGTLAAIFLSAARTIAAYW